MSHEIRTPMNGILGVSDLLLQTPLSAEQREYVEMTLSSGEALLSIINDILDFSKVEAGRLELEQAPLVLAQALEPAMKLLALRGQQKGLEVVFGIAPDLPQTLIGDAGRLRQIVVNLVANAIKFTDQGEVVVELRADWQTASEIGLHISVRDTGIGIPEERQKVIFQAFAQADATHTRRYGGTGLGLTITARLAELMGGRTWVESEPGRGSTFHVTARLAVAAGHEVQPDKPPNLQGTRLLIVDDNATNRRILTEMARSWKMTPTAVDSGAAAVAELHRAHDAHAPYQLVLLDAQMPGLDGFEVAERILADPRLSGVPLMMLSSAADRAQAERCRALGLTRWLVKPVTASDLFEAVQMTLQKAQPVAAMPSRSRSQLALRRLSVLVAEDNAVNQRIVLRMLENAGHAVTIVENGRQAVEAVATGSFDVILMDVQMPVLGGIDATVEIRRSDVEAVRNIPIVALTAQAMQTDRQACLDAGMNAYLTKPVRPEALLEVLDRVTAGGTATADRAATDDRGAADDGGAPADRGLARFDPPAPPLFEFDPTSVLQRIGGDEILLREMAELFLREVPGHLNALRDARGRGDLATLRAAAHTLKGAASNLGAPRTVEAADRVETLAGTGAADGAAAAVASVEVAVGKLISQLEGFLRGE